MQIHEFTRRPVNEISFDSIAQKVKGTADTVKGTAKSGMNLAGRVASGLGTAATTAAIDAVKNKTGVNLGPGFNKGNTHAASYGAARGAAAAVMGPVIQKQAKEEMAKWNQGLQILMNKEGVTSPEQLSQPSKDRMIRSLNREIHNNFLRGRVGTNFKELPEYVIDDPNVQREANAFVKNLSTAAYQIQQSLYQPPVDATKQLEQWSALSNATYNILSLVQFESNRASTGTLSKEEEARRQLAIDRLKNEIETREKEVEKIKARINSGDYSADTSAIAQKAFAALAAAKQQYSDIAMGKPTKTTKPTATAPAAPAVSVGGEVQNPNDPATAKLMAMLKQQGKI